jgi:peptidoglycan/xylan/chitin deacetylase (PgdA/CDA1 family)
MRVRITRSSAAQSVWQLGKKVAGPVVGPLLSLCMRLTGRRAGIVLVYHVIGDRTGRRERELVAPIGARDFERQLAHLDRWYGVVALSDLLPAAARRRRGQKFPVCVTFDDDHRSHLDRAAPVLRRRATPATFFLCGNGIEAPRSMWWQRLQRAWDRSADPATVVGCLPEPAAGRLRGSDPDIHAVGAALEEMTPGERDRAAAELGRLAGPDPPEEGMRSSEIAALAADGFEIGFHTRRHDVLVTLEDRELAAAMIDGRDELASAAGARLSAIAYPHGYADERVARAARSAGFELGLTAQRSAVTPAVDPMLIGRCDPVGFGPSLGAFALGLSKTLLISARPAQPTWLGAAATK